MKRIITLLLIFMLFSSFCFSQENIGEQYDNILNIESENNYYKNRVKNLDKIILRKDIEYKKIENKLNNLKNDLSSLEENNNILNIVNQELRNKKITKQETEIILFNYFKDTLEDFKSKIDNEEGFIVLFILYIFLAIFLYILFFFYTLPLRFIRFIWRKITGYKECSSKNNNEFNELIKKYSLLKHKEENISFQNCNLIYEVGELEKRYNKLKNKNNKLEDKNINLLNIIREKENKIDSFELYINKYNNEKIENTFIFDDNKKDNISKNKKDNYSKKEEKYNTKKVELIKDIASQKNKKSKDSFFDIKEKTDLFGKTNIGEKGIFGEKKVITKTGKFSLGGSTKGGLFN